MTRTSRGQSGIDRLLFFIVGVVLLVAVLPFVLQFAGTPVRGPAATGDAGSDATELRILAVQGADVKNDGSIGSLRVVVTGTGGADTFNLQSATLIYSADRAYHLFATSGNANGDGVFRASADGPDAEDAAITGPLARGVFTVDLGSNEVPRIPSVGQRLRPGQQVTVTVIAPGGAAVTRNVTVPEDTGGSSVPLR